jgi:hypothetical protein
MFWKKKNTARIELINTGGNPQNGPTIRAERETKSYGLKVTANLNPVTLNIPILPPGRPSIGSSISVTPGRVVKKDPVEIEWKEDELGAGWIGKIQTKKK